MSNSTPPSAEKKAREFWLLFPDDGNPSGEMIGRREYTATTLSVSRQVQVHVIEYSAVEELERRLKNGEIQWCTDVNALKGDISDLQAQLKRTELALKTLRGQRNLVIYNHRIDKSFSNEDHIFSLDRRITSILTGESK